MRSWMLARASPATGPLGEITRGREKFTQRGGSYRVCSRHSRRATRSHSTHDSRLTSAVIVFLTSNQEARRSIRGIGSASASSKKTSDLSR